MQTVILQKLLTTVGLVKQQTRATNAIPLRSDTSYFNQFLGNDLDYVTSYTPTDALNIIWHTYKHSYLCHQQFQELREKMPSLTRPAFKQACKEYCTSDAAATSVFA